MDFPTRMKAVVDLQDWFPRIGVSDELAEVAYKTSYKIGRYWWPGCSATLQELHIAYIENSDNLPSILEELFTNPAVMSVLDNDGIHPDDEGTRIIDKNYYYDDNYPEDEYPDHDYSDDNDDDNL